MSLFITTNFHQTGGDEVGFYDTDVLVDAFRQESYFQYLFGVQEAGFYGAIRVSDGFTTLFAPRLPDEYAVWMGKLWTLEDFKKKYEVDEVCYVDEIERVFKEKDPALILTLNGKNSDSGRVYEPAAFKGIESYICDTDILFPILAEW
jgi:Xaa-Pro dipeptidase